ncbi:hypothetical protein, partial [Flavobacterium psychrophilum]|uniref:hypothetical protein n=1 Tax=Flavobacterium psychrophilum TaxID=96345 RepID=UPI001C556928
VQQPQRFGAVAKKVLNSRLSFARNLIFNRKYAVTKFTTSPSGKTFLIFKTNPHIIQFGFTTF